MKRFLMILTVVLATSSAVNAQTGFTVGARLGPGFAFNKLEGVLKDMKDNLSSGGLSVEDESNIVFALAVYGNYEIFPRFSVQAELGLMINNGVKLSTSVPGIGSFGMKGSFMSLDIPVLARYDFLESPVSLGVLGGPYLSVPIGKLKTEITDSTGYFGGNSSEDFDIDGIRFGITAGVAAGYKLGPGSIVADLRFLMDLAPVKIKDSGTTEKVFTRRGVNLTVGYEISF
jgi:hypothetical protein